MSQKTTLIEFAKSPVEAICQSYGSRPDALIEILHDVQHEIGHVPESSLPIIAKALNLSRAEVYGVATFYHDFHLKPSGKHHVKLCRAEACQSMGGRDLQSMIENVLNVKMGGTNSDKKFTLEPTYCLGLCASAPAMMVNGKPIARMNAAKFEKLVGELV
jgi:formate dehydrogenase subunit gamma